MKHAFLLLSCLLFLKAYGQDRYIPHIPASSSLIIAELIVANTAYEPMDGVVEAYDASGLLLGVKNLSLPHRQTIHFQIADLFPGVEVSTLKMPDASNDQRLLFTVTYGPADLDDRSHAHAMTASTSPWRLFGGSGPNTNDGVVLVNTGGDNLSLSLKQVDATGATLGETNIILGPMATWLGMLSSISPHQPGVHYQFHGDGPMVAFGIRTHFMGGLFWENPARPTNAWRAGAHLLPDIYFAPPGSIVTRSLALTNTSDQTRNCSLTGVQQDGGDVSLEEIVLSPSETRYLDSGDLHPDTAYMRMDLEEGVQAISDSVMNAPSGTSDDRWMQAAEFWPIWRFYTGDENAQFDAVTIINNSQPDLNLVFRQVTGDGQVLAEDHQVLATPSARLLWVNGFASFPDSHFEVIGSHDFFLSTIRFSPNDILYKGAALPDREFCQLSSAMAVWTQTVDITDLIQIVSICSL